MNKKFNWCGNEFEISNVYATVEQQNGEDVLKIERDLNALPFDEENMINTVDEPTFVKLKNLDFVNGIIEVKILSKLLDNAPSFARGFIGVTFRTDEENKVYESIYLRPTNSNCDDQLRRNHTIQYYSYPNYKFNVLRDKFPEVYETFADIELDKWINMKIEVNNNRACLFLDDKTKPSFIVNELKGNINSGSIGLWVDIGTQGYFKDLKITKK